jgi:excisionase family DNA binding protein
MECFSVDINDAAANTELLARLPNEPPPTNCELLARPRNSNQPPPWFAGLSDGEFHAQIAARIDAWRVPWERGKDRTGIVDEPDDEELVEPPVPPQPEPAPADSLKTPAQAARRLNISIRTLRGLISSGELRYVNVGHGKQREKIMLTDNDINDLIASRTRQKAPQSCPSTSPKARRSTTSTSSGEVVAFTALRSERIAGKRKP